MKLFWKYLKPYKWLALFSMLLAVIAQALTFLDPVIFGKIIDNYALNPENKPENELVKGILWLLLTGHRLLPLQRGLPKLSRNMY